MKKVPHIWLPSEDMEIKWYTSQGYAVGIENIVDQWTSMPVAAKPQVGVGPPRDSRIDDPHFPVSFVGQRLVLRGEI